jgi:hypothetical protein
MSKVNWKAMDDWELAKHMTTISDSGVRQQRKYWTKVGDIAMLDKIERCCELKRIVKVLLEAKEYGAVLPAELGL